MPCLFAWFFFVIRGGYAQRNTFFRRSGRWQRASCNQSPHAKRSSGAVALVVLVVAGVGWAAFSSMRAPAFEVHADEAVAPSSSEPEAAEVKAQVYVYVTGAVANPGVYSLDEGLRVCDAVEAAGGLTEDADASTVNLARVLSDGEHIALPTKAEVETALAQGSAGGAAGASSLVNINTADASALETLSGVGSATAQAIISDREQNGPFSTIEDLMRVDGIGEKKFAKLKDSICV